MADDMMDDGMGDGSGGRRRMSGKRLIIFIAIPLLLIVAAGAGLYFSGIGQALLGKGETEQAKVEAPPPPPKEESFKDVPDMLVNLNTGSRKAVFLKITVSLELDKPEDGKKVEKIMPRIVDTFQTYMRELRLEDLRGSAGLYRLREELLLRVNAAMAPDKVDDVLFKELLVQ